MPRLDCLNGAQRLLIVTALARYPNFSEMAEISGVHPRTLRDWKREKYRMSYEVLQRIYKNVKLDLPSPLPLLPDFWQVKRAAQLGGQRRFQLHGSFGSLESCRKGGMISAEKFRRNPELARATGFKLRKPIRYPKKSILLAELVGILLGDGCLSNRYQVAISFNSQTDEGYGRYVRQLFPKLFGIEAAIFYRVSTCTGVVAASSRALVEYLETLGLYKGNKVARQVDVPRWIWEKRSYQRGCLRGLIDTDGSVYAYEHKVIGHHYWHMALCFTNRSKPLLRSVGRLFENHGFHPVSSGYNVRLNRSREIERYFQEVGSKNSKHLQRYCSYQRRLS